MMFSLPDNNNIDTNYINIFFYKHRHLPICFIFCVSLIWKYKHLKFWVTIIYEYKKKSNIPNESGEHQTEYLIFHCTLTDNIIC